MPQGFVRQHRAELFEDDVQVEQKKDRRQDEHENRGAEERLPRHSVVPVEKRTEAEVDEAEKFCAVQRVAPGTFLFLKIAHLPESKKQQAGGGERGDEAKGLSQSARAVSAQTISDAGKPQNKADKPRARCPSERSSSALFRVPVPGLRISVKTKDRCKPSNRVRNHPAGAWLRTVSCGRI